MAQRRSAGNTPNALDPFGYLTSHDRAAHQHRHAGLQRRAVPPRGHRVRAQPDGVRPRASYLRQRLNRWHRGDLPGIRRTPLIPSDTLRVTTAPLISIGMPVCNGERYLREAIESVLNQTVSDLELVISDNASTDGTEAICRE